MHLFIDPIRTIRKWSSLLTSNLLLFLLTLGGMPLLASATDFGTITLLHSANVSGEFLPCG